MNKEICRFNITMDDIFFMNFLKAVADLLQNVYDLIFGELSTFAFDIIFKILLTIFQEEIQMFFGFGRFIESGVRVKLYLTILGLFSLRRISIYRLINSSFLILSRGMVFTASSSDLLFFTYPR